MRSRASINKKRVFRQKICRKTLLPIRGVSPLHISTEVAHVLFPSRSREKIVGIELHCRRDDPIGHLFSLEDVSAGTDRRTTWMWQDRARICGRKECRNTH